MTETGERVLWPDCEHEWITVDGVTLCQWCGERQPAMPDPTPEPPKAEPDHG